MSTSSGQIAGINPSVCCLLLHHIGYGSRARAQEHAGTRARTHFTHKQAWICFLSHVQTHFCHTLHHSPRQVEIPHNPQPNRGKLPENQPCVCAGILHVGLSQTRGKTVIYFPFFFKCVSGTTEKLQLDLLFF